MGHFDLLFAVDTASAGPSLIRTIELELCVFALDNVLTTCSAMSNKEAGCVEHEKLIASVNTQP